MFSTPYGCFLWETRLLTGCSLSNTVFAVENRAGGRVMEIRNQRIEIRVGNVEMRLCGPVPRQLLDRELNPHLPAWQPETGTPMARVYEPENATVLTGALSKLKRVLRGAGVLYHLKDVRSAGRPCVNFHFFGPVLRPYQEDVIDVALRIGHGIIDIGTGGGKTLLAAAITAMLRRPTLYVVTTRTLLHQTRENLGTFLGITPGEVGDGRRTISTVTVALAQSLTGGDVDLTPFEGGTLVWDEGHHAAAQSWQSLIRRIAPRYHYYLSAVPYRNGGDQVVLDALAGPRLTGGAYSARFLIERGFACPVEVRVETCRIEAEMRERTFATLYREFIVGNRERNGIISSLVREQVGEGRSVLVLVDHVRHGELLQKGIGSRSEFVCGATGTRRLTNQVKRFAEGRLPCLIATSALFQEGVSIDGIEVLVQAGGLKSRSKVIQAIGRGMRKAKGKDSCLYVDFLDDDESGYLRGHSLERLRVLKEEGFDVPSVSRPRLDLGSGEAVPPVWSHVAGSNRFVLMGSDGRVRKRAVCLDRRPVPARYCEKCRNRRPCQEGGTITWQEG